jgi:hypothetical protein
MRNGFTMIPVLPADSVEETAAPPAPRRAASVVQPAATIVAPQLGRWAHWQRKWNRNALKRDLARIVNICKDHESNDVKPGDPVYAELYCVKWGVSRGTLEVQLPCLRELRLCAHPEGILAQPNKAPLALLGIFACLFIPFLIGIWTGLFSAGQHLMHRMLGG